MDQASCFGCGRSLEHANHFEQLTQTCAPCLDSIIFARGVSLSVYLESRPHPAAVLAPDQTVLFANSLFRALRPHEEVVGLRVGEVIDCVYSATLGRCGETEVCILCSLRRAAEHTWRTGEGLRGVSMNYLRRGMTRKSVELTTEKVGGAVLVVLADRGSS